MLRQNTSQAFKLAFLGVVFSLCSQNVLSDGVKQIEFLQKIGTDSDHYTVTAEWDSSGVCVDFVLPRSVQTVPGYENAQTMNIHYLETSFCSEMSAATQLFVVKSVEHTERVAQLWWEKKLGQDPSASVYEDADPYGLLWIDNTDSNKIKVWVSFDRQSR
ncbi:hypothetical protein [Endozoicomonas sp. 8E]|uniref:hypothetical protein n=1 Tax=Endozoicomonas sp. 8E TaxID=3035692 RepID=UPI0029391611|nr:hypothetical protein [Endozoicomonas sp. 8E]WOG27246.1 hypothetical protein P6910_22280 [Endozoicomonas sp. 8E]